METLSTKFMEVLNRAGGLPEEASTQLQADMENYDRPYFDELAKPTVVTVSKYGYNHMHPASRFAHDPWDAKRFHKVHNEEGTAFFTFKDGEFTCVDSETASKFLYDEAKALGLPDNPALNPSIVGSIVSFDALLGSVPEHMREVLERIDPATYTRPMVTELRRWYEQEVLILLKYMACRSKRVKVTDDAGAEHWVDSPVTALSVGFGRFDAREDGATQTTAFFSVSDQSPEFKPEAKPNWHLQDSSRWLYAGALAINYTPATDTQEATVRISSNH